MKIKHLFLIIKKNNTITLQKNTSVVMIGSFEKDLNNIVSSSFLFVFRLHFCIRIVCNMLHRTYIGRITLKKMKVPQEKLLW